MGIKRTPSREAQLSQPQIFGGPNGVIPQAPSDPQWTDTNDPQSLPTPPTVSLTPQGVPSQAAPVGGIGGGIPQQAAVDPFDASSSPEARAEHFMTSDPNYADARKTMGKWETHQAKRADLENQIAGLATKWGVDPNNPAASLGDMAEHAAGSHGADGGLITRMLTMHSRQMASRQDAQRKTAATGLAVLKFMNETYKSGDENMLSAAGKYTALGAEAKALTKEYAGQDHKDERADFAEKKLALYEQNMQSQIGHRDVQDYYAGNRDARGEVAANDTHMAKAQALDVMKQYGGPMAAAKLAAEQTLPAWRQAQLNAALMSAGFPTDPASFQLPTGKPAAGPLSLTAKNSHVGAPSHGSRFGSILAVPPPPGNNLVAPPDPYGAGVIGNPYTPDAVPGATPSGPQVSPKFKKDQEAAVRAQKAADDAHAASVTGTAGKKLDNNEKTVKLEKQLGRFMTTEGTTRNQTIVNHEAFAALAHGKDYYNAHPEEWSAMSLQQKIEAKALARSAGK